MSQTRLIKADLHVHTEYSMDCGTPLEKVIRSGIDAGINCIAVADHGTTEGALKLQKLAPFTVIVAEEILTPNGEVMGMFLKETIPSNISIDQAISRIREQDGLICIPHPFDVLRRISLDGDMLEEVARQIDIVETFNSRSPSLKSSVRAGDFARKYGLAQSAGSDAHTAGEIGRAYVEMPEFTGKDDFLQALKQGRVFGRKTGPLAHFNSLWARLKKRL
ncbi:MAG: PHP domain-containing protein [Chloroflexi bacterium]|nr:PHP domain-containing protein [Chloroflexota bacterium]